MSERKINCHASGDRCHGCAHYRGEADTCVHAQRATVPVVTAEDVQALQGLNNMMGFGRTYEAVSRLLAALRAPEPATAPFVYANINKDGDLLNWSKAEQAGLEPLWRGSPVAPFQERVDPWLMECFGLEIARDILERNHRFLEEALELVQANGCTVTEAHQLVDYVYGRDQGEINQEVGGVMVTLAALCLASGVDMHLAAETELARIWTKVEKIRAKHFAKPKFSPLPGYAVSSTEGE